MNKARMLLRIARLQPLLLGLGLVRTGLLVGAVYGLATFSFSVMPLLIADLCAAACCVMVNACLFTWHARLGADRSRGDPASRWFIVRYFGSIDCLFSAFVLALPIQGLLTTGSLYFLCASTLEHNGVKVTWLLAAPAGELDRLRSAAEQSDHA